MGWMPGSLIALRELPAETCLLPARTGTLKGESCALGPCFLVRTENNFHLVEIYRNIIT